MGYFNILYLFLKPKNYINPFGRGDVALFGKNREEIVINKVVKLYHKWLTIGSQMTIIKINNIKERVYVI